MTALSRKNLWEKTPAPLKRSLAGALSVMPPSFWLGKTFREQLSFANDAAGWPAERSRAYQSQQLREIVTLAKQHSPYWRDIITTTGLTPNDIHHPEDIRALPFIDKQTLIDHGDQMLTRAATALGIDAVSTGGSSGVPLTFHIGSERSAIEYAYLVAGWQRAGYQPDMPQVILRGAVVEPDRNGLRYSYDPILRRHQFSNFHMTDDNMARYIEKMATLGDCFLHVYPSSIAALTRYMQRSGPTLPPNVRGILAGSEIVYDADRLATEQLTGLRYFSWYGHSEKLVLAAECEHDRTYHVWPTYGYCELIDEHGNAITTPGQRGEIVGTGFINRVQPFIRYRTGDYATYLGDHCPHCGRDHVLLGDIQGHRTQEMLICSDGSEISWTAINMHDGTFAGVRQFQFRQDTPGKATLRVVPASDWSNDRPAAIKKSLDRKLAGRIVFEVALCDDIQLTKRGKMTFVDQRIPDAGERAATSKPTASMA